MIGTVCILIASASNERRQERQGGIMQSARLTMRNGKSTTYRASMISEGGVVIENNCLFGRIVDKLGRYEDIGTPEEFALLKKEHKKRAHPPR